VFRNVDDDKLTDIQLLPESKKYILRFHFKVGRVDFAKKVESTAYLAMDYAANYHTVIVNVMKTKH